MELVATLPEPALTVSSLLIQKKKPLINASTVEKMDTLPETVNKQRDPEGLRELRELRDPTEGKDLRGETVRTEKRGEKDVRGVSAVRMKRRESTGQDAMRTSSATTAKSTATSPETARMVSNDSLREETGML